MAWPQVSAMWNGFSRSLAVVFVALLTLQSSDELDSSKIAYLVVVVVASLGSIIRIWKARRDPRLEPARPLIVAFLLIGTLCATSVVPAFLGGTDLRDWIRDVSTYALLALAPVLAIDAWLDASPRAIAGAFIVAGSLATASFVLQWLERRQLADFPIDRLFFPSFMFAAGMAAFLVALAVQVARYRVVGSIGAGLVLSALLLTETRSSLVLLAAPIMILVLGIRRWARPAILVLAVQIGLAVVVVGIAQPIIHAAPGGEGLEPGASGPPAGGPLPSARLNDVGAVITDPMTDQSFRERILQTQVAIEAFRDQPILGNGPGHRYEWTRDSGTRGSTYSLDTPFVFMAKFGLLGLAALTGVVLAGLLLIVRGWRRGPTAGVLGLIGFLAVMAAWLPFGWPPEDKGTSLALIMLLALALPTGRQTLGDLGDSAAA